MDKRMYYRVSLEDGKKLMLEILSYIDDLCEKNGLEYFVAAGTLLGAVRHKGFIPWDDDIDIVMTKKDRAKLIELIRNDKNERFDVLDKTIDSNYPLELSKVIMKDTLCILNEELKSVQSRSEVFVDIFTMDFYNKEVSKDLRKYVRLFENARKKVVIDNLRNGTFKNALKAFRIVSKILVPVNLIKVFEKKYIVEDGPYIGYSVEQESGFLCKKEYVFPLRKIKFENIDVWAPNIAEEILTSEFGSSYMELPPEDKRQTHSQLIAIDKKVADIYNINIENKEIVNI